MDGSIGEALAHHRNGRLTEAERLYRAILDRDPGRHDPEHRDAAQLLGALLAQTGRAGEAVAPFRLALSHDPHAPGAWSNLAAAIRTAGRPREALHPLRRALALDPAFADAWVNLGNTTKALTLVHASRDAFGRAIRVNPDHGQARRALDGLLAEWGARLTEAERLSVAAGAPDATPKADLAAAAALFAVADLPRAIAHCRRVLAIVPTHAMANDILGRASLEMCGIMEVAAGRPFEVDHAQATEGLRALITALAARPDNDETLDVLFRTTVSLLQVGYGDDRLVASVARFAGIRLRRHPKDVHAATVVGFHLYRRGRLAAASRLLHRHFLPRFTADEIAGHHELGIWSMLRAEPAFLDSLPSADAAVSRLAPMVVEHDVAREPADEPFVMFSCDDVYFRRFAPALLESVATHMPGATVVAHVVNPSPETLADAARWITDPRLVFGFSHERPDMDGWSRIKRVTYFASARFMRAYQWKRRLGRPLMVVDTDASIVSDLRGLSAEMAEFDVGLLIDPRRRGPSRDVTVCFNHYNATPGGDAYLGRVAAYIGAVLEGDDVYWMLDQMAHYAVLDHMRRRDELRVREYDFPNFPHCRFVGAK